MLLPILIAVTMFTTTTSTRPISSGDIAYATTTLRSVRTPVLSPTVAPMTFTSNRLSTHLGEPYTNSTGYIVVIGTKTNCFSNECAYSIIMGENGPLNNDERAGSVIKLPNGQTGYYQDIDCSGCNGWASIKFGNRTEHYSIAVQGGSYDELLTLARGLRRLH